jgi:hypothetical protein
MSLTRKDVAAVVPVGLAVAVYLSNSHGWLLTSNRWAAGAVFALGMVTCTLGRPAEDMKSPFAVLLGLVGAAALALFVAAERTSAQWALALLTLAVVVLWAGATVRHTRLGAPHPA